MKTDPFVTNLQRLNVVTDMKPLRLMEFNPKHHYFEPSSVRNKVGCKLVVEAMLCTLAPRK